ncbi:hypothetical protein B484DRAFT_284779 [Ochromonadaceae sp. CCMP2298]|nr:hypothetical protein B484DRAFT_284779 [Ochromonadaceae sp. CCMP2298]
MAAAAIFNATEFFAANVTSIIYGGLSVDRLPEKAAGAGIDWLIIYLCAAAVVAVGLALWLWLCARARRYAEDEGVGEGWEDWEGGGDKMRDLDPGERDCEEGEEELEAGAVGKISWKGSLKGVKWERAPGYGMKEEEEEAGEKGVKWQKAPGYGMG